MRKFRHVYVEMYKRKVYFAKCSRKQFAKMLKVELGLEAHQISEYNVATTEKYTAENRTMKWPIYVIWITDWRYLAHEIFHCVHWILNDVNMRLSDDSEEAYAYLTEYLDNQLRKGIK